MHGDKQQTARTQSSHMNISSLALTALAIYKVKQRLPTTLWWKRGSSEAACWAKRRWCSIWKQTASACDLWHTASTCHRTYTWSHCVQLCLQSQHQERGTVGISFPHREVLHLESFTTGEATERPFCKKSRNNFFLLFGLSQIIEHWQKWQMGISRQTELLFLHRDNIPSKKHN